MEVDHKVTPAAVAEMATGTTTAPPGKVGGDTGLTSADYYWNSYSHFGIHEEMLKDKVRTESYRRAIQASGVVAGKVVLDVGCGTGILSLFAASAGAKRVYSIECAEIIEQARQIVKANHFEDVIVLIKGKVEEVEIPEKVDVLISEWMGYFLMYESMLKSVIFAREKWLKPGGVVLPDKCSLFVNGIEDAEYKESKINWWRSVYGYDMSCIRDIALAEPLVDVVEPNMVVTTDYMLKQFDVMTVGADDLQWSGDFSIKANREDTVHAIVTYFDVEFTESHVMFSTGPNAKYTHWKQAVMYLKEPVSMKRGEVLQGKISCKPNAKNNRDLDITLHYTFRGRYHRCDVEQVFYMR